MDVLRTEHTKAKGFEPLRCKANELAIRDVQKDLNGNGKGGLIDEVNKLGLKMARVETKLTISITLLTALLVAAGMTMFNVLK